MSENQTTNQGTNEGQTTTQNQPDPSTQNQSQTQQQNPSPPQTHLKPEDLFNAVQGMPEKIVNAIREAGIGGQTTQTPPPNNQGQENNNPPPNQDGKSKSFVDWWFGN